MSRVDNQRRLFLELVAGLRPHWRHDAGQPARLQRWLAGHRAGSRDRRLYRELAYTTWRVLPWIEAADDDALVAIVASVAARTEATAEFIDTFRLAELPAYCTTETLLPAWLAEECPAAVRSPHRDKLLSRAPLWIRLQSDDRDSVAHDLQTAGWQLQPSEVLASAGQVFGTGDLTQTDVYRSGRIEIQDLGSQLLLPSVQISAGERWFDACAGAGGKSLQLAQLLGPNGEVEAADIRPGALAELQTRVQRAAVRNVRVVDAPRGQYDGVLVDAPCSGSGTWRRAPHLKWTTQPADLVRQARRQGELLHRFSASVRPGGKLIYATCSLCRSENEAVVERFLSAHPEFTPAPIRPPSPLNAGPLGLAILPGDVDSDGFFVAALERRAEAAFSIAAENAVRSIAAT